LGELATIFRIPTCAGVLFTLAMACGLPAGGHLPPRRELLKLEQFFEQNSGSLSVLSIYFPAATCARLTNLALGICRTHGIDHSCNFDRWCNEPLAKLQKKARWSAEDTQWTRYITVILSRGAVVWHRHWTGKSRDSCCIPAGDSA